MKNTLLLLILSVIFLGCQTPSSGAEQQETSLPTEPTNTTVQTEAVRGNDEYLDWNSLRINGKLPLMTSVKNIHGLLGEPDSVVNLHPETCNSYFQTEDSKFGYYDGYQFEQLRDSIIFKNVDFRKNKEAFLQINDLKFSSATTLEELKKYFPNAVKDLYKTEGYNMYNIGNVDAISLRPSPIADGSWVLLFQNGKLIMIDSFEPC